MYKAVEFSKNPELLIQKITDALTPYLRDIKLVIVFGSLANYIFTPTSDVDILIVGKIRKIKQIQNALDDLLFHNGIEYDLFWYAEYEIQRQLNTQIIQEALKGRVIWRKPGEFFNLPNNGKRRMDNGNI